MPIDANSPRPERQRELFSWTIQAAIRSMTEYALDRFNTELEGRIRQYNGADMGEEAKFLTNLKELAQARKNELCKKKNMR